MQLRVALEANLADLSAKGGLRARRVARVLLTALLAVFALFFVGGYFGSSPGIGSRPEWRQITRSPSDFGLQSEVVSFSSIDGIRLKGWWLPSQGASEPSQREAAQGATLVLAHGRDESRSGMLSRAAFLVRNGYNVLDIDLRGHGESDGKYITPGYLEALDILGAVAHLRGRGQSGPLGVLGYSYGAVAALHAAARCADVNAVIADSAFKSTSDILKRVSGRKEIPLPVRVGVWFARMPLLDEASDLMFWARTGVKLERDKIDASTAVKAIREQPILFISGEKDWLAPPENAREMYEQALNPQKRFLVVPGAGHTSTYGSAPKVYEAAVLSFLETNLPKGPVPARPCR